MSERNPFLPINTEVQRIADKDREDLDDPIFMLDVLAHHEKASPLLRKAAKLALLPIDEKDSNNPENQFNVLCREHLIDEMFLPKVLQIASVMRWNVEKKWGYQIEDFLNLEEPPEVNEENYPSLKEMTEEEKKWVVPVLTPYLPDLLGDEGRVLARGLNRTFDELWDILATKYKDSYSGDIITPYEITPYCLRRLQNKNDKSGLFWSVISLQANRNRRSDHSWSPVTSPGPEILASIALHPEWIRNIAKGIRVSYIWLPGYEYTTEHNSSERYYGEDEMVVIRFTSGPQEKIELEHEEYYHGRPLIIPELLKK